MDLNYQYYKKMGICPKCRIREHAPGRVSCEICLAKDSEAKQKKIEFETKEQRNLRLEKMRIGRSKKRTELKNIGKCIWCGKPVSSNSTVFCIDCRIKNQRNNDRRKSGIERSERPHYGICYRCGKNPIISGKKLCIDCYEKSLISLKMGEKSEKSLERKKYIKGQNNLIFGRI